MRILFMESNPVWIYGLPSGFRDLGHEVMISGPLSEKRIRRLIFKFKPNLVITIGWGVELTGQKQDWIRKYVGKAGIPLVYWAVEDPVFTEKWSLPLIKRMKPDFVFSICTETVSSYQRMGIKAAHLDYGYHPDIHYPVFGENPYRTSLAVVANAYPHVLKEYTDSYRVKSIDILIKPLLHCNKRIDFWGNDWLKMRPFLDFDLPSEWVHGFLPYTEANKVYSAADIVLGLQNFPEQLTQRTYEILGSGGLLLTLDTPEVRRLFHPGRELLVSSSPEETVRLVEDCLRAPAAARLRMREAARFAAAVHSYTQRAAYMTEVLLCHKIIKKA